ncbi:unnamed protein product [Diplocarpon coronariae]|uniref:Uncharacterized protein n=1 Tax=Diplocarpon coronariae TaxID=2795749 RepID=A0A218ZI57_9HELO|nr:hypothetical protein B2J93_8966 [Marssonina coronariae]
MYIFKISWIISACSLAAALPQTGPSKSLSQETSLSPVKQTYADQTTGTFNGSVTIVPIDYNLARKIIPKQWRINQKAYLEFLPEYSNKLYPLVLIAGVNHRVGKGSSEFGLYDFQTVHISFPFVDIFKDGYSSFSYNKYQLITSTHGAAIDELNKYKTQPIPAAFWPDLEAYSHVQEGKSIGESRLMSFEAYTDHFNTKKDEAADRVFSHFFAPARFSDAAIKRLPAYMNITNQPTFTDGELCDNKIFLYNTTLSSGKNSPEGIVGSIILKDPLLPGGLDQRFVSGIRFSAAFVDFPEVPCANLRGYHEDGSGKLPAISEDS